LWCPPPSNFLPPGEGRGLGRAAASADPVAPACNTRRPFVPLVPMNRDTSLLRIVMFLVGGTMMYDNGCRESGGLGSAPDVGRATRLTALETRLRYSSFGCAAAIPRRAPTCEHRRSVLDFCWPSPPPHGSSAHPSVSPKRTAYRQPPCSHPGSAAGRWPGQARLEGVDL